MCVCMRARMHAQVYLTLCDPTIVAYQAPLSTGFFRQDFWSGFPFPPLGDLPDPGIAPVSPALAGRFFIIETPGRPPRITWKTC